jgi:hypothetical protein
MWPTLEGTTSRFVVNVPKPSSRKDRVKYWEGVAIVSAWRHVKRARVSTYSLESRKSIRESKAARDHNRIGSATVTSG